MAEKMSVTIVGPGSLGAALSHSLHAAGIPVAEVVYRSPESAKRARKLAMAVGTTVVSFAVSDFAGEVVWLCVGDAALRTTAAAMAPRKLWKGAIVFHSSGALSADELASLRRKGASVASVHPMMSFVKSEAPSMQGVTFALEGDRAAMNAARKLVKALGGESFEIAKKDKALYHALGAFVSPLIVAQMATAERVGRELKLDSKKTRQIIAPILQQTIHNYIEHGPASAFSGPIIRGDVQTVKKNLAALKRVRGAAEIYRALARVAVEELPSKDAKGITKIIR